MELYTDHLYVEDTVEHRRMSQMRNMNYRPEYETVAVVPSETNTHAYLVGEVRCLDTPYSPELDVLDHRVTVYICSCDDYWYNRSMGIDEGVIGPSDLGMCKHCVQAFGLDID